ncbi:HAD family hydrolase [Streptomyces sp. NPDC001262]|uniref:HAD family hydrolase n=1 Tax=Streptomyces sp. NPDC001262 TaxID=3364552 RepID=UPI0036D17236
MTIAVFDLDDTLINRQRALTEWTSAFCHSHGLDEGAEKHLLDTLGERAYPVTFERLRQDLALEEPTAQLWAGYIDGIAAGVTANPGVIDGLVQLRAAGWRLGILTNGAVDIQRAKICSAGLADLVDAVTVSEEIGARKPAREAFEVAVARCGGTPSRSIYYVGDNPVGDIGGADAAGLSTVWLRGRPWPDCTPAPHHTVDTIADAIVVLLEGGGR